jgi:hypothetical protein
MLLPPSRHRIDTLAKLTDADVQYTPPCLTVVEHKEYGIIIKAKDSLNDPLTIEHIEVYTSSWEKAYFIAKNYVLNRLNDFEAGYNHPSKYLYQDYADIYTIDDFTFQPYVTQHKLPGLERFYTKTNIAC